MNKKLSEKVKADLNQITIIDNPSEEQINVIQNGLTNYNKKFPGGELDIPTPDISLILLDRNQNIMGGVITSMLAGIMHLEVLWVDEKLRRKGLGKDLVLTAEKLGRKKGYPASQTWTFSFQAPEFYQSIGYKIKGICQGYCDGVTEYVLSKNFKESHLHPSSKHELQKRGFTIIENNAKEAMRAVRKGLIEYNKNELEELHKKYPRTSLNLVLKNGHGRIIGGLLAFSTLKAVNFECLWVDKKYRNRGYGKVLLETLERKALKNGSQSILVMVYSFQSLEFFQRNGFEIFGSSDNYPNSITEYYLIKWLK
jgi:GNAT superfamily N-acetyltransferase